LTQHPVRLYVERRGAGPPIVLAHGFGGSARNFRLQARDLAGVATVLAYDARGHARSEAPAEAEAYDFERLVDDFEHVADEAGGAVIAGGVSLGAITALAFAARRPERVRGVLLASLPGTGPERVAWAVGFAEAIEREGLDGAGAKFVWGERSRFDPEGARLIRQGIMEHPPHALAHILRRTLSTPPNASALAEPLRGRELPVTILAGADDAPAHAPSHALLETLPQATLEIVPKAGHVLNLAVPALFNERLKALADAGRPAAP
jgi:2-succinyl-6-hydroxy-2,4-cyclohexadiene-1-carboxylate synthase